MGVHWTGNSVRGTCKLEAHSAISKATKPQSAAHSFEDQVILSAADLISFSSLIACATVGLPADRGVIASVASYSYSLVCQRWRQAGERGFRPCRYSEGGAWFSNGLTRSHHLVLSALAGR